MSSRFLYSRTHARKTRTRTRLAVIKASRNLRAFARFRLDRTDREPMGCAQTCFFLL